MQCVIRNENIWCDHTSARLVQHHLNLYFLRGRNPRDEEYWSRAVALGSEHRIFVFYGGSEHYASFLIRLGCSFDFLCKEAPDLPLDPAAYIVPSALIARFFDLTVVSLSEILLRFRNEGVHCSIVCPPPPKSLDGDELRRRMEPFFVDKAKSMGLDPKEVQYNSSVLMLKLWHSQAASQRDLAHRHGFDFMMPPPNTVDDVGFLKPVYWQPDITHANELYGQELLEAILRE